MSIKRYEVNGSSSVFEDESGSLVDYQDYAALEAKCAALAAENAGLKKYICDDCYVENIKTGATKCAGHGMPETPATESFLAEVRAQGAEECVRQLVISDDDDFSDAPNVCAMVAHQLRKGVQS